MPDYETALLKYQAALREFEMSEPVDEASQAVDETSQAVDETATGHGEEVPSDAEARSMVGEVVVQAGPAQSALAVEPDNEAEELRRYFAHPARLWGALVLVPFLGAAALAAQPNGKGLDQPWVFGALAVWLAATPRRRQPCRAVAAPDAGGPVEVGRPRGISCRSVLPSGPLRTSWQDREPVGCLL